MVQAIALTLGVQLNTLHRPAEALPSINFGKGMDFSLCLCMTIMYLFVTWGYSIGLSDLAQ